MTTATAPADWLEDLVLDLSELDLLSDLDPGLLDWEPESLVGMR